MEKGKKTRKRRYLRSRITQRLILDAAHEVFLENGYHKATITEISKRANVGYGTVYSHYQGKDDILNRVIEKAMEKFFTILEDEYDIYTINDVYADNEEKIHAIFKLASENKKLFMVMQKALSNSDEVHSNWNKIITKFVERVKEDMTKAQGNNLVREDVDINVAAKTITLIVERYLWEIVFDHETELEYLTKSLTDMVIKGLYK